MAGLEYTKTPSGKIWGILPCHEIEEFDSVEAYERAYRQNEDELADEAAEYARETQLDIPEDFAYLENATPSNEWLRYA